MNTANQTANVATEATNPAILAPDASAPDASAPVTAIAAEVKAKKVNPLNEARKSMLKSVREERMSLADCKRLLAMFGAAWLKEVRLTRAEILAFEPSDLQPFQKPNERYRAIIGADGNARTEESGWTPAKVCKAIERRAATLAPSVPIVTPSAPIVA